MYCPRCRTEYREGFGRCTDCDVTLVNQLEAGSEQAELTKIFETAEPSLIPVVESVLRTAGIEFLAKNQNLHSTVPGTHFAVGPVEYWVADDQAEDARALLRELASTSG